MTAEQQGLLVSLVSLVLVFASPLLAFLSYQRNVRKDKLSENKSLEKRFDSIESTMKDLTSAIQLLNAQIVGMTKSIEKNEKNSQIIEDKLSHHDATLANHEARINNLEDRRK